MKGPIADAYFTISTMIIAIPTGVKIFNWIATMWGGSVRLNTAMMYAIAAVATFTMGGVSGVMHATSPHNLQQTDTYFVVAHFHYVLLGGLVLGLFGGLYYWYPKITGRFMNERLGKISFWFYFLGLHLTFLPMHWTGLLGMPRRVFTYSSELGLDTLNMVSTVGGFVQAVAMNGAGAIHDVELAMIGATSEDVASALKDGSFGMARDTAQFLNEAAVSGAKEGLGFGEAVGRAIDVQNLPNRELSLLWNCRRRSVPATVHVTLGADIVHMHPSADGAAIGKTSLADFRRFAESVARLQGGVYFNVGSDHIDPETSLANRLKAAGYATIGEGKFWEYDPRLMGFSNYTIRNYETFVRESQDHLFAWIDEHAGREPMFIWWAPELPHVPHDPPERLRATIDRAAIPIPAWFHGDVDQYREREQTSLAMVAWLDEGIAELCDKLREKGVYEDTLFCFLIDNGWANGLVSKGSAFDKGLRTPVIFAWSNGIESDAPFADLVSPVDLHATLLDYAGVGVPPDCEGRTLRARIEGRVPYEPREALYGALYPQTPLEDDADAARDALALWARTERWKYVTYLKDVREADDELLKIQANLASYPEHERGDEELYDLFADPYELENLAGRPEHAETKSRLRDEALAWWRATGGGALDLP